MRRLVFLFILFIILFNSVSLIKAYSTKTIIDKNNGILVEKEDSQKIKGYIIKFKQKSVLEKKIEIEKYISDMEKKGGIYTGYAQDARIQLPLTINEQRNIISREHQIFLGKGSLVISNFQNKILNEYKDVFNGITLDISESEMGKLKKLSEVKGVYPNLEVHSFLSESVPLINADDVWKLKDSQSRNITGKDVKIAIIDTGIDYTHPDLGGCLGSGCKVIDGYDFVNNDNDPIDDNGHGTHCAGIASGNGTLKGVAPDAKLYAYKVLDSSGYGWAGNIIAAIEKSQDPNQDGDYSDHVDVLSMSLGGLGNPDDPLSQAVDMTVENGVVVVAAAGNSGPSEQTIRSPGCARKAITVGSTDKTDKIASSSSRGPVFWDDAGIIKPDLVAPGVLICSAQYDSAWDSRKCFDDKHVAISGTSMATPHVAGTVALIKQAHPDWNPDEIKSALKINSIDLGYDINTQGYGRIDALSSVQLSSKPPVAFIETHGKFHGTEIKVNGTATAESFERYTLYYKDVSYADWNEICTSTFPKTEDTLCIWDIRSLNDGKYMLKLETRSQIYTDKDFVYVSIENTEITYPNDLNNEDEPAEIFPSWKKIEINGTASGYNFEKYTLEICDISYTACTTEGIILTNGGLYPVDEGILGVVDPSFVAKSDYYFIQLSSYTNNQLPKKESHKIYINKELHHGWPKKLALKTYSTFVLDALDQPTIADMDNDRKNDLIFAYENNILVFKHDGTYVNGWPKKIDTSCGYNALMQNGPAVADLDKDGYNEIVIGDNCGYLHVFKHDGNYVNGWPKHIGSYLNTPIIADIDNDGNLDIIVGDWSGYLHVLNLTGDELNGWPKFLSQSYSPAYGVRVLQAPAVADLDKDGYNEIVAVNIACPYDRVCYWNEESTRLWVLNHDGMEVNGWPKEFPNSGTSGSAPVLADLDKDGELEIIIGFYNGSVFVWNLDGSVLNGWPVETNIPLDYPSVGDINKDGNLEVIIGQHAYSSDGNLLNNWPVQFNGGNPMLNDLDSDEGIESSVSGTLWNYMYQLNELYAYNPDSSVVEGFPKILDDNALSNGAPIGDLDNDGYNELIIVTWTGNIFVWDLPGKANRGEWPEFYHDEKHTGLYYSCNSDKTGTDRFCHEKCGASPGCDGKQPGTGCCAGCYDADINQDNFVNIFDITTVALAFGADSLEIKRDGILNSDDIKICEDNQGKNIWDHYITGKPNCEQQHDFHYMGDVNDDGYINETDLNIMRNNPWQIQSTAEWQPCANVNKDMYIGIFDVVSIALKFGKSC